MDAKQKTLLIKELRERTGSGFLDVKKALEATNFEIEAAIAFLQEKGKAIAAKKSGRIAADGLVRTANNGKKAIIFELNSETDFVTHNAQFLALMSKIEHLLLTHYFMSLEEALKIEDENRVSIQDLIVKATATIGEKISLRRAQGFHLDDNTIAGAYTHTNGRVAALLVAKGKDEQSARNVAMHVSAMNPEFLSEKEIPNERLSKIRQKIVNQVSEQMASDTKLSSKPEHLKEKIAESMIKGKVNKELATFTLLNQEFVMETSLSVAAYLSKHNLTALVMVRYEVGEGIAKNEVDFAAEVAEQMNK